MNFGEKIKKLRLELDWTQEYVANQLQISVPALSRYESGMYEPKSLSIVSDFAKLYNVSTDYLLNLDLDYTDNNEKTHIPVLGRIPAGIPIDMIEDILDYEDIPAEMIKGNKEYFGLRVKGDSMEPNYLDGDTLIVLKQDSCESGQDCIVAVNGDDATFKRVFINDNGLTLQPLNNKYQPLFYTNEEIISKPVKVLGVVKEIRRSI